MSHKRAGFTLIELVVAILIRSILTTMAFSSFASAMGGIPCVALVTSLIPSAFYKLLFFRQMFTQILI